MGFATMVSVGSGDFYGVWDYEGRLPHGVGDTGWLRSLFAVWREFLGLVDFRGFRVFLRW